MGGVDIGCHYHDACGGVKVIDLSLETWLSIEESGIG
jgi:hypothetical protein